MKKPKVWQSPQPQHFAPADLAALLPSDGTGASNKRESWLRNITSAVLEMMRFGQPPKAAPPPEPDVDPRLARIGIRQIAPGDSGPRGGSGYNGGNQYLPK